MRLASIQDVAGNATLPRLCILLSPLCFRVQLHCLPVEVDASSTGVGAVLSWQAGNSPRLHPCAFFSLKLSLAELNYDIGDEELLAIKLAL